MPICRKDPLVNAEVNGQNPKENRILVSTQLAQNIY